MLTEKEAGSSDSRYFVCEQWAWSNQRRSSCFIFFNKKLVVALSLKGRGTRFLRR